MPGPPGKHPSRRARTNNARKDFVVLPRAGRSGRAPKWPLQEDVALLADRAILTERAEAAQARLDEATDGRSAAGARRDLQKARNELGRVEAKLARLRDEELPLWRTLWRTPQAVQWEEAHAHRAVALFVRLQIKAEMGDMKAATEARQWSDRLGLHPLALLRLRQEIETTEEAEARGAARRTPRAVQDPPAPEADSKPDPREGLKAV